MALRTCIDNELQHRDHEGLPRPQPQCFHLMVSKSKSQEERREGQA